MKRLFAICSIYLILAPSPAHANPGTHWAEDFAKQLDAYDKSVYNLIHHQSVSRSEFTKLVKNVITFPKSGWYDHWFSNPEGFPGNQNPITRGQAIDILVDITNTSRQESRSEADLNQDDWYSSAILTAKHRGWINGYKDGTYRPYSNITGGEVIKILANAIKAPAKELLIEQSTAQTSPFVTSEPISYKGGKIPAGSQAVEFLRFTITNPTPRSLILQSLRVKRMGLGDVNDIEGISIWEGFSRLTSSRSIPRSDQEVTFSFPISKVTIHKNSSKTFSLRASIAKTANTISEHYFVIQPNDIILSTDLGETIQSDGNKIIGDPLEVSSVPRGELTIQSGHTPRSIAIGNRNAILGELILEASGREDLLLKSLKLENKGTLDDTDLANLTIVRTTNREVLSGPLPRLFNGYAEFDFSHHVAGGVRIDRNDQLRIFILGDVVDGSRGATVRFELDDPSDAYVIGLTTGGYRTFNEQNKQAKPLTRIQEGSATISRTRHLDKVGSNTNKVIIGQLQTVVRGRGAFMRRVVFDITVNDSMIKTLEQTSSGVDKGQVFRNVSIIDPTGARVAGPIDPVATSSGYKLIFNDDFIIPSHAMEQGYYLLSDIKNADNGDRYQLSFNQGASQIEFDY